MIKVHRFSQPTVALPARVVITSPIMTTAHPRQVHAVLARFFGCGCYLLRLDSLADGATPATSFIIGGRGVVVDAIICAIHLVLKIVLASAFDNHAIYSFLSDTMPTGAG